MVCVNKEHWPEGTLMTMMMMTMMMMMVTKREKRVRGGWDHSSRLSKLDISPSFFFHPPLSLSFQFSRTFTFLTFYMYSYISTFTLLSCCFTLAFCFPSPTFISLSWKGVFFILSLFPCLFSGLSQCVPLPLCAVSWPCFLCRNTAPWLITLWMKGHVCLQTNNTTLSVKWRRVYLLHTVYTYHSIYTL